MADHSLRPSHNVSVKSDMTARGNPMSESALNKQIQATHAPDGKNINVRYILTMIEDILRLAHASSMGHITATTHAQANLKSEIDQLLAYPINKVSGESHQVTMDLLKSLAGYTWEAKLVIALVGFAINYGELGIETLSVDVIDLLNQILKVTHCIIKFKELPAFYTNNQSPELTAATAHIPSVVYWCVRGIFICASTLSSAGHAYITTTVSWKIPNLAHKLKVILDHLENQLIICLEIIERKKLEDAYNRFRKLLENGHLDNMPVLTEMFQFREDQRPLYDGSRRTNERLTVLKMKYVLLLISDLDLPQEELHVLHMIHSERLMRHDYDYEVLWVPIIPPGRALEENKFYKLRNNMLWYSVDHPSLVNPVVVSYALEELKLTHRPMLVVLDPHGKLCNHDALPMIWIWGAKAFPFSRACEKKLWEESDWNIEQIADHIDPRIQDWISDKKVICLYGGDDIVWIRSFTRAAMAMARAMGVALEMMYVAKRNPGEKVRRCHEMIDREKLSHIFARDYQDYVWFFWERLASMWISKKQIGRTVEDDVTMKGILDLFTFDSSEQGWAFFSRGNFEMTMAIGGKALHVVDTYADWANEVDHPDKFVPVLHNRFAAFHPDHHCNRLILPGNAGYIPETAVCNECEKTMDKYVMYRCCTD